MKTYQCRLFNHQIRLSVPPSVGDYLHLPWIAGCAKPCHAWDHQGYVTAVDSTHRPSFCLRIQVQKPGPKAQLEDLDTLWLEVVAGQTATDFPL